MNPTLKKFLPHLIAYLVFVVLAVARFAPAVFEGKVLHQNDNVQALGMQQEVRKYSKEGIWSLWTNAPFAGMPSYQIVYKTKSLIKPLFKTALWGNGMAPAHTAFLLLMACMYLLLVVLRIDWRLAVVGSIGFAFSANHMGLLEAGHSTKLIAAAYMAPMLAGLVLTFRGKYWLGGGLLALFTGLELYANHVQVTYYFFLMVLVFGVAHLIAAIKEGTVPAFFKAVAVAAVAVVLGISTSAGRLMTTQEYAAETIRGKSELNQKPATSSGSTAGKDGLSKDYAFNWSYGKLETFNLLIPNFVGGSSSQSFLSDPGSATTKVFRKMKPKDSNRFLQNTTHYWGAQPFTSGGVYMGALFFFLFFLACFLVKTPFRGYVIGSVVLAILLSWGANFKGFNYFMFDHFPLYNKFRDPKTVLDLANLLVVAFGLLGLQYFFGKNTSAEERKAALLKAGGLTGGLIVLGLLLSFTFDYVKGGQMLPPSIADALAEDRAGLLRAGALRSLLFAALGFGLLWAWMKSRFAALWAVVGIGLLAIVDVWGIGTRFVSSDSFVPANKVKARTEPTAADKQIMADPDPYYRVADFRRDPFRDAITCYHHKSMGGYHAAKLMRYQEVIEKYLNDPSTYGKIYGMFNAKYFIDQQDKPIRNPDALGNAWFVKKLEIVPDADTEFNALATLEPRDKAIVQEKYAGDLKGFQPKFDSTASIQLTNYLPDEMTYSYSTNSDQLAVFSEVYYPPAKGWKMYIDGQPAADFTKADFILRAAKLPAGQHELKMVFHPDSYYTGEMISLIGSILAILAAAFGIYWFAKNYGFPQAGHLLQRSPLGPKAEIKTVAERKAKVKVTKTRRKKK
ncbi:MAG TPA: hypothetical protein ENJ95_07695 [Bacteroidetes bacterium]|nr:hypothetical protein [Bacteroidota bacterium]